ncbi:MAG: nucleotidyltransferase domain-containing protein [Planctomycetes bacterium]|nr:nucleotidyltransferase domain-containing protein [Planctomycetota bacterium]
MHPVRSIDLECLPELRDALTSWLDRARATFRLDRAYLFGSFARGNPHEGSDIDLVLIGPFRGKMPYRITSVLLTTDLPVQPLCYTPEEWEAMVREGNPLALEVMRTGVQLRAAAD